MSEIGELFQAYREAKQAEGHERRWSADDLFRQAKGRAEGAGLSLIQIDGQGPRAPRNAAHYQLRSPTAGWLLNIYPGNGRLYWDPRYRGPFLRVREGWTLLDVIEATIQQMERGTTTMTDTERTRLRKLQDRFLSLPPVRTFADRRGEDAAFWPNGPTIRQVRECVLPEWADRIAEFNRGDD